MQKDAKIRRKLANKEAALPGVVGLFVVGVVTIIVVGCVVETVVPASVVGGLVVG